MASSLSARVSAACEIFAVGQAVAAFYLTAASSVLAIVLLVTNRHIAVACSILFAQAVASLIPLTTPHWAKRWSAYACAAAGRYFPITITVEAPEALQDKGPFIIGLEPHSALPTSVPAVFNLHSPLLPAALRPCHGLASSVCFHVPLVRHVFWWLGVRPVTKASIHALLKQGRSVVIIPGGVQEILLMQHDREVAYLRKRLGFVRMALQTGVPLLPVFAFGQTSTFSWWRPGPPLVPASVVATIARAVGVVPMMLWGVWGSPLPHKKPVTVVIGRPIDVPRIDHPSKEEVERHLQLFISSMQELFERHKAAAGCAHLKLYIH